MFLPPSENFFPKSDAREDLHAANASDLHPRKTEQEEVDQSEKML